MWSIFTTFWGLFWLTVTNVITFIVALVVLSWYARNSDDDEEDEPLIAMVHLPPVNEAALRSRILQLEEANTALKMMLKNCDADIDDDAEQA